MLAEAREPEAAFRHEALLYAGEPEFLAGTTAFIREGLTAGEPILVVVSAAKIALLRTALGADSDSVYFADMAEVGHNPALIIPAWREFVTDHADRGRRLRGIGEPIWCGRSPAELVECQRHESLLNIAFADAPAWWLLCPYDTAELDRSLIDEAHRSHPFIMEGSAERLSPDYRGLDEAAAPFDAPLPEPRGEVSELSFRAGPLGTLRAFAAQQAARAGFGRAQTDDLVLAVQEVAANSLRYGGGRGTLRIWQDGIALICEIRDAGRLRDPLVGRERPQPDGEGGRGLWLVNHLCDLVQLRSFSTGTVVRLHMLRN